MARRRLLARGAAFSLGAVGLALVGCGGDDDDDDDTTQPSQPTSAAGGGTTPSGGGSPAAGEVRYGGTHGQTYGASDSLNILTNAAEYAGLGGQFVYDHLISTRTNENAPFVLEAGRAWS